MLIRAKLLAAVVANSGFAGKKRAMNFFIVGICIYSYGISLGGPSHTMPRPGRKMLISSRVGEFVVPVRSNGRENGRQLDVPLIRPMGPEPASPKVREKYWPSG